MASTVPSPDLMSFPTPLWWAVLALAIVGMEVGSYVLHRYFFHGWLWRIHRTHHTPPTSRVRIELNDVFTVLFAALASGLCLAGRSAPTESLWFAAGAGVSLYGVCYFVIHDLLTHGRWTDLRARSPRLKAWLARWVDPWANPICRAHWVHHARTDQTGQGPWGLFGMR